MNTKTIYIIPKPENETYYMKCGCIAAAKYIVDKINTIISKYERTITNNKQIIDKERVGLIGHLLEFNRVGWMEVSKEEANNYCKKLYYNK